MTQVVCDLDGSQKAELAARAAVETARREGRSVVLRGVVRSSRWDAPQPAVGARIERLQRIERQLVLLARATKAKGVDVQITMPGQARVQELRLVPDRVALKPAAA